MTFMMRNLNPSHIATLPLLRRQPTLSEIPTRLISKTIALKKICLHHQARLPHHFIHLNSRRRLLDTLLSKVPMLLNLLITLRRMASSKFLLGHKSHNHSPRLSLQTLEPIHLGPLSRREETQIPGSPALGEMRM